MVHAGCVLVSGIYPSRTYMSRSFESVWLNACVHRLDLGLLTLYSHLKEFEGMEPEPLLTPRQKNPFYWQLLGGHCLTQDSEPNTLVTELFRPQFSYWIPKHSLPAILQQTSVTDNKMLGALRSTDQIMKTVKMHNQRAGGQWARLHLVTCFTHQFNFILWPSPSMLNVFKIVASLASSWHPSSLTNLHEFV